MDSISQATLGGAIGQTVLGKKIGEKAAILGAIVATILDFDVALYLFYDKFEMLGIHRGYSHSILFSVIGAFLISMGLIPRCSASIMKNIFQFIPRVLAPRSLIRLYFTTNQMD